MAFSKSSTLAILVLFLGLSTSIQAITKHALLVGINDYPVNPLQGPQFDAIAVKKALKSGMGFKSQNIQTLLNEDATKDNILAEIDRLYENSVPGDKIFIYFSGHGTSASDNNLSYPLPTTTGAFIPFDVLPTDVTQEVTPKLVVGRTDLRPRLEKLDKGGRSVFFVMDACYSGNAVRGIQNAFTLPKRYMDLNEALSEKGIKINWERVSETVEPEAEDSTYPYQNVYFLAAAGEHEVALEISKDRLEEYPTFDGRPHGAFTDSLLRVFDSPFQSDLDQNGDISYAELRSALRRKMETRNFSHTPHGLPALSEDKNNLNNRQVLLWAEATEITNKTNDQTVTDSPTRIVTGGQPRLKRSKLSSSQNDSQTNSVLVFIEDADLHTSLPKGFALTQSRSKADLALIRLNKNEFAWITKTGDIVLSLTQPSKTGVKEQLAYLKWRNNLKNSAFASKHPVNVELIGRGKGTTARRNETIGFSINLPQGGQIMLLNADPNGDITVLYPINNTELNAFDPGSVVKLADFVSIQPPYGQDLLFAVTFEQPHPLVEELMNTSFRYNASQSVALTKLLQADDSEGSWGMDYLTLTTTP